ncbi:MAG: glycosyltransferase [Nonlabens sp.]
MAYLSIVSPVYRAEKVLPELIARIEQSAARITNDFEIILVEDCGPDRSWSVIEELAETKSHVKGIKLSRNFGQHYAIACGLDNAQGEWIVVLDCDLQDQPEEIPKLYQKAQEGYDVVLARRSYRKDKYFKKLFSKLFYRTLGYLTGSEQDETVANFGIYHHKVIDSITSMRESIRYFPTSVKWVGFKQTKVDVEHSARFEGESSYNFSKLINLAIDIILAFSDKPLRLVAKTGLIVSGISFAIATYYLIKFLLGGVVVIGYTSLIVSLWFLSGIMISTLGVVGLYIGKIFEETKKRPIYVVQEYTTSLIKSNEIATETS